MRNILFVGPLPPPVHGQALHFMETFKGVENCNKFLVSINATGRSYPVIVILVVSSLIRMIDIFVTHRIDTVYFTCSRSRKGGLFDFIVIGLSKIFGAKIINHLHGADFRDYYLSLPGLWKKIASKFYGMIDLSIVLTEGMKDQLLPFFPGMRVEVVPNFYAEDFERDVKKRSSSVRGLLYLSNIMMSKGIFDLLGAFKNICHDFKDVRLSIAGDFVADELMSESEVRKAFQAEMEKLRKILPGRVEYLSVVRGEEKVLCFMESDIFILPSYYRSEAFPISIIEAMRSGNAVITTRHNYLPEIVSERNGVFVEPRSSVAIGKALVGLLNNAEKMREIQVCNISQAKDLYSYKRYRERISEILDVVTDESRWRPEEHE
ncbi:MAG: glycosyltransferase family 4 protein [Candidatus Aminicenantes bacterium]|nr:glycosyltransferase family 4 protein [Candidatus Aminicenantes bacterium]